MTTICIDPGLRCTGLAVLISGLVVCAAAIENPSTARGPEAWIAMATAVVDVLNTTPALRDEVDHQQPLPVNTIVVEKMVSYPGSPVRVDDLMELVGVTGAIVGMLPTAKTYKSYRPREWKGQVAKPVHNRRVLAKLSPSEQFLLSGTSKALVNNAIDAIGLGLVHVGRMKKP